MYTIQLSSDGIAIAYRECVILISGSINRRIYMADDNSTGTNMIWAIAMIIIVAIIAGALYYSGALSGRRANPTQKIDVEVSAPSR